MGNICEIILNLDQRFRGCCLKISYLELSWPFEAFVQWSGTICAILLEGIIRNISVTLVSI